MGGIEGRMVGLPKPSSSDCIDKFLSCSEKTEALLDWTSLLQLPSFGFADLGRAPRTSPFASSDSLALCRAALVMYFTGVEFKAALFALRMLDLVVGPSPKSNMASTRLSNSTDDSEILCIYHNDEQDCNDFTKTIYENNDMLVRVIHLRDYKDQHMAGGMFHLL